MKTLKLLGLAGLLIIASCQNEQEEPAPSVPIPTDPTNKVPPEETVGTLTLSVYEGVPTTEVEISEPKNVDSTFYVTVLDTKDQVLTYVPIEKNATGNPFFIIPLHTQSPVEGGEVVIQLTNNDDKWESNRFTIEALPPAPGYYGELVEDLKFIIDKKLALYDITPKEMAEANWDSLQGPFLPLAIAQHLVYGSDNPNSLQAAQSGEVPFLEGEINIELLDRLLALNNYREITRRQVTALDSVLEANEGSRKQQVEKQTSVYDKFKVKIEDGYDLEKYMGYAKMAAFKLSDGSAGAKVRKDMTKIFTTTGFVPEPIVQGASNILGLVLFTHQKFLEADANTLPSSFVDNSLRFEYDDLLFEDNVLEETPVYGSWYDVTIWAESNGWKLDKTIFETVMQGLSAANYVNNVANEVVGINDFARSFGLFVTGNKLGEHYNQGVDIIEIPPFTWEKIPLYQDQTEPKVAGSSIVVCDSEDGKYAPVTFGVSELTIETAARFYGAYESTTREVTVPQGSITITPADIYIEPGESIDFTATVSGFQDMTLGWATSPSSDFVPLPSDNRTGTETATLFTSTDLAHYPIPVTVKSLASKADCEGNISLVDEEQTVYIRSKTIEVTVDPLVVCVEVGSTQQFTASVTGTDNKSVTWSASGGSITQGGKFTPTSDGEYTITATSVENADAAGIAQVFTGCSCLWTVSVSGGIVREYWGNFGFYLDFNSVTENFPFPYIELSPSDQPQTYPTIRIGLPREPHELKAGSVLDVTFIMQDAVNRIIGADDAPNAKLTIEYEKDDQLKGKVEGTVTGVEYIGEEIKEFSANVEVSFTVAKVTITKDGLMQFNCR